MSPTGCRSRVALALAALTLSALAARADGPNLLADPSFKKNLTGWTKTTSSFQTETWVRTDSKGNPNSGSVKIVNSSTVSGSAGALKQCVAAAPGSYVLRGSAWVSGGLGDSAAFAVSFFSGAGCTNTLLDYGVTPEATAKAWTQIAVVANAPAGTVSAYVGLDTDRGPSPTAATPENAYIDDLYLGTGKCAPGGENLCLLQGRFQVEAQWTPTSQPTLVGKPLSLADTDGSFWFTSAAAPDLDVRILNGCAFNASYWVLAGGLVGEGSVLLTVTDTVTGAVKTYTNSPGTTFAAQQDTAAFACP